MKSDLTIEKSIVWNRLYKVLKRGKPIAADDWNLLRNAADGCPDRINLIEKLQSENFEALVNKGKKITKNMYECWKLVDLAAAENYYHGQKKERAVKDVAERVAKSVALRAELGEMPDWDDEQTKAFVMSDPAGACWHYFPKWFYRPRSKLTESVIRAVWEVILHGGNQAVGVIRGGGKSTITKALLTLAGLVGVLKYVVVFGANDKRAQSIKKDIVRQLETNDLLLRDFPAACIPIRALSGKSQRCTGQSYGGERTYIRYESEVTQLAVIPGAASSGFMIRCCGVDSGFLGLVENGVRPDFVLGDDIQNLKLAKSDSYVAELEDTVRQGFEGLGGKENPLRIVLLLTCTRENDFPDRLLNRDLYPEYSGVRFGLVEEWGTGEALWEEYVKIYRADLREGDKRFRNATQFYINNRGAMDDGVVVTDPEFYVHETEVSAIQGAWNARARMGDKGYFAQMENRPISMEASLYTITPSDISMKLNGLKRTQVPGWGHALFAFSDVGADKLRWAVWAVGAGDRSAVVDYGDWPKRGRVAPKNCSGKALEKCVWSALEGLRQHIEQTVYTRGGEGMRITAAGFDRGWEAATVQAYCAAMTKVSRFPLLPMRGQGGTQWREGGGSKVIKRGWNTHLVRTVEGAAPGEFINVKSDFWKEFMQRSFLTENFMAPGACSLWGNDHREHGEFADHCCAEVLLDKGRGRHGSEFWSWAMKPGGNNHFGDVLAGCMALAGYYGYLKPECGLDLQDQPAEVRDKVRAASGRRQRVKKVRKAKLAMEVF
jgi:hypothetical protein